MSLVDPLRLGVIGLGPHFREDILPALSHLWQEVRVTALCDKSFEARHWRDYGLLFPDVYLTAVFADPEFWRRVDCVFVNSWPQVHEQVLRLAIKHGKHCLCEKPVASSAAMVEWLMRDGIPPELVLKIGHVFRYRHGGQAFIEAVETESLACLNLQYIGAGPVGERWGLEARRAFALTHLTHAIDLIVASAGPVQQVLSVKWQSCLGREFLTAVLQTERCPHITLFATNSARAFRLDAQAVLEHGALVRLADLDAVYITGLSGDGKRSGPFTEPEWPYCKGSAFQYEIASFVAEINGTGECLLPGLESGRQTLLVIEEIERQGV